MANVSIKMDDAMKEALTAYADKNDLSLSWVIRKAITEFLEKESIKE
jgi:predicted transcriptional regulator